jgi:hypothetical protein
MAQGDSGSETQSAWQRITLLTREGTAFSRGFINPRLPLYDSLAYIGAQ